MQIQISITEEKANKLYQLFTEPYTIYKKQVDDPYTLTIETTMTEQQLRDAIESFEPSVDFDATSFKNACIADPDIAPVMMLAPAALIDAINEKNFTVVQAGVSFMVAQGLATQAQSDKFNQLLLTNHGEV